MLDIQKTCYEAYSMHLYRQQACRSVVPCNVFGPHDNFNVLNGHVIPGLINKAYEANKSGQVSCICYVISGSSAGHLRQLSR